MQAARKRGFPFYLEMTANERLAAWIHAVRIAEALAEESDRACVTDALVERALGRVRLIEAVARKQGDAWTALIPG